MWLDNETDRDFLNFTGVAETVAEIIVQAEGRPKQERLAAFAAEQWFE